MSTPKASLLIPVYNRHDDLRALLEDLRTLQYEDFEVVVVDDGSVPPVAEILDPAGYPYTLRLLVNEGNRGVGYSRNRAFSESRGAYLVWIDSDCRVFDPDWLNHHIEAHQTPPPGLGLMAGEDFVLHSRVFGRNTNYAGRTFMYSNLFASCFRRACRVTQHHVPTMNTSLPRRLMERVGEFDERLRVAEDSDWCLRALACGVPLIFVPGLPVEHRDRGTMRSVWNSFFRMGTMAYKVRLKNAESPFAWVYPRAPWQAALMLLPLSVALTVYITWRWILVDPRVIWCIPGMYLANLAYALGVLEGARAHKAQLRETPGAQDF